MQKQERDENDSKIMKDTMKINAAMLDMLKLSDISLDKIKQEKIMQRFMVSLVPESMKNISADRLKEMLLEDYILQASVLLAKNFKERAVSFPIHKNDHDIVPLLQENWEKNKITSKIENDMEIEGKKFIIVRLTW